MTLTAPWPVRAYLVAVLGAAALVGGLAGISPKLAVAAALGLAFAVLVVADLTLGLCLFIAVTFLDEIPSIAGLSVAKAAGALLVLSWVAAVATRHDREKGLLSTHPLFVAALILLGSWAALSSLWAQESAVSLAGAQRWALNLALFPIVFAAVRQVRDVRWVMAVFVIGGLATAAAGVVLGGGSADLEGRLGASDINPNALGGLLIVSTVFAAAIGGERDRTPPARAFWWLAALVALIALAATLSRGALFGLAVAMLAAPFVAGPRRRAPAFALAAVACGAIALGVSAFVPDVAAERLTSSDQTGSGRTDIWRVGLRMAEDNLVLGVGADNFDRTSIRYLVQPGVIVEDDFIINQPKVAHNIYLQVLAELGVVGLALWLGVIGFCLLAALRAANNFARDGNRSADLLARALLLAMIGLTSASFFSSQLYSKPLFLLLALAPATLAVSRRG